MRYSIGLGKDGVEERLERNGISRRDFMKFCSAIAVTMGLAPTMAPSIAQALTSSKRPSVVYVHNAECTGCSEALLRAYQPYIDEILFDTISLDYHETLMASAGEAAEDALNQAINNPDGFICLVEGAIPMGNNGMYGTLGGHTMYDHCLKVLPKAKAVVCVGTCACFGGIQAAAPNPTDARGVNDCFKDKGINAINIAGCPPNPLNIVGMIVAFIKGMDVALDGENRPNMFFGKTVHEQCERLPHFEAGEFALSFNSEEAKKGWCLHELGCKGPMTYNNCPKTLFNEVSWPVKAGHPCIGCSENGFWDLFTPLYEV